MPRSYLDIEQEFSTHPLTKDLLTRKDVRAVSQSIKNLVLTDKYESLWNPDVGAGIYGLLFENVNPATDLVIRQQIEWVITTFEPRADLKEIEIDYRYGTTELTGAEITVIFALVDSDELIRLPILIESIR